MYRLGPEDYQSNRHIRKLLHLAGTAAGDAFYDLGCGRGQLCVVAVTEFDVKRAVGIELHKGRAAKPTEHIKELGLTDRIEIRNEDFMESDLHDATVVYSGLGEIDEDVEHIERQVGPGCRIVTLFLPLVGVLPTAADYPFYLMKVPFRKTSVASLWISKVLFREASVGELFRELDNDREYRYDKRTLKRIMEKRFPGL